MKVKELQAGTELDRTLTKAKGGVEVEQEKLELAIENAINRINERTKQQEKTTSEKKSA